MRPRWNRLQSIPQSVGPAGVEPAFHRVSDGRLAARLRPGRQRPVRDSNPSRLLARPVATPAASQGGRVSSGNRTRLSDAAGPDLSACRQVGTPTGLGCSATDTIARTEGVEPSASRLELDCSPGSTPLSNSGRNRTRTCKGLRLARLPTGCHRACWLALPNQAVPAGLEPATVWLTASRTTVVLRDSKAKRTEQESNLNEAGTRLTQGPMTSAPGRTPTLSGSSGGWGRASGLRVFSAALLPPELHRNEQETLVGVEPTSCDFADRRLASRPQDQNRAGGGTRTHFVRVTRAVPGPSSIAGIFFEQPVLVSSQLDRGSEPPSPAEGLARRAIQSQRRDSNTHAPLYKRGARPIELRWHRRCRVDSRLRSGTATVT